MLSPPLLAPALTRCRGRAVPLRDVFFRAGHLRFFGNFARATPLYAVSPATGSRYVPPGGPDALYASFDEDTPYREVNQNYFAALAGPGGAALAAAGGLRPEPLVETGPHVVLSQVLDLFDQATRATLGIVSNAVLLAPWKGAAAPTPTQVLGQAVFNGNFFEGIVYPSAQLPRRKNLVVFPLRLQAGSRIHFKGFTTPTALKDAVL